MSRTSIVEHTPPSILFLSQPLVVRCISTPMTKPTEPNCWKSDGTASGTVMVKDINSGSSILIPPPPAHRWPLLVALFIEQPYDGTNGNLCWMERPALFLIIKDINAGDGITVIHTRIGNVTGFTSMDDGTNGHELWKSEPNSRGTRDGREHLCNLTMETTISLLQWNCRHQ